MYVFTANIGLAVQTFSCSVMSLDQKEASTSGSMSYSQSKGIPVFLSQVKEWVVDCGFDTVQIYIRTSAYWYKLETPHPKYARWFNVVLKCARLAVHILSMITGEVSSTLSTVFVACCSQYA